MSDRESIQFATSMVIGALARNALDTRRAATLLYGLQVASVNVRKLNHRPSRDYIVTETTLTPAGDEIAPNVDPRGEVALRDFLQSLEEEDEDQEDE